MMLLFSLAPVATSAGSRRASLEKSSTLFEVKEKRMTFFSHEKLLFLYTTRRTMASHPTTSASLLRLPTTQKLFLLSRVRHPPFLF